MKKALLSYTETKMESLIVLRKTIKKPVNHKKLSKRKKSFQPSPPEQLCEVSENDPEQSISFVKLYNELCTQRERDGYAARSSCDISDACAGDSGATVRVLCELDY